MLAGSIDTVPLFTFYIAHAQTFQGEICVLRQATAGKFQCPTISLKQFAHAHSNIKKGAQGVETFTSVVD